MVAWRTLSSLALLLAAVSGVRGQTYPLAETAQTGDCAQFHMDMNLTGEMRITRDNKPVSLKLSAQAKHVFPERVLVVDAKGVPQKVARAYETARAVIQVDKERSERSLRPERNLIVVQRPRDQTLLYCPKGPLRHAELELTSEHFDTISLTGLLPGKEVKLQETWKVTTDVVQALCHFEGITTQDLVCKLEEITDNRARVVVNGAITGIDRGALVKLTVEASYHFDVKEQRLVAVQWKQKDEREAGPASPASATETTYTVKRSTVAQPAALTPVALISVPDNFDPPTAMLQLDYHDSRGRFDLTYGRDWQIVSQTTDHLVLRYLNRGDFVAQVTITPWTKFAPGEHLTPEAFQKAMAETPGWEQTEVLQAGEVPSTEPGRWVYRISALGQMDGLKLLQNFYVVAGPGGDQVVLAFTMTQAKANELGSRDLSMVGSIELPPGARR